MYLPPIFAENDRAVALSLMRAHGFATIFTAGDPLEASHAPTLVAEVGERVEIEFHLAVGNPQCRQLTEGSSCLVVYLGPHCYVSPTWYAAHPNVPTWNYQSVQAEGVVSFLSTAELEAHVAALSAHYEDHVGGDWRIEQLATDFKDRLLKQIRGFRVTVSRLQAKSKLNQNRTPADRDGVMQRLLASPDPADRSVGRAMAAKFGAP